jgi:hypothetical protein
MLVIITKNHTCFANRLTTEGSNSCASICLFHVKHATKIKPKVCAVAIIPQVYPTESSVSRGTIRLLLVLL